MPLGWWWTSPTIIRCAQYWLILEKFLCAIQVREPTSVFTWNSHNLMASMDGRPAPVASKFGSCGSSWPLRIGQILLTSSHSQQFMVSRAPQKASVPSFLGISNKLVGKKTKQESKTQLLSHLLVIVSMMNDIKKAWSAASEIHSMTNHTMQGYSVLVCVASPSTYKKRKRKSFWWLVSSFQSPPCLSSLFTGEDWLPTVASNSINAVPVRRKKAIPALLSLAPALRWGGTEKRCTSTEVAVTN